jgi:L-iditol 2-dehydrogenase
MKFGVLTGDRNAEIHEHEVFKIKPNEVLIHNKSCNICTTDYQQWQGFRPHQKYPMAWGHENSGIVAEVGSEVKGFETGDHVVENIYHPCLECSICRKGLPMNMCEANLIAHVMKEKNQHGYFGTYGCSQYKTVLSKNLIKISKELPFEEAGFCEPLATVISGIDRLRINAGENILVVGAGTMGLLNAQVARYYGANVIISELIKKKRNIAKTLGFQKVIDPTNGDFADIIKDYTKNQGPDAIIVAVGATEAYNQAFSVAPMLCRILIFAAGYPPPDWDISPNLVHYQLWEIIGAYGSSLKAYQKSADILSSGELKMGPLIEERYPLKDIQKAFEHASTPGNFRVSLIIPD